MLNEPTRSQVDTFCHQVDRLVDTPRIDRLVATYFDPSPASRFAGFTFDSVGADTPGDEVCADDLLAVSLLDVRFKAPSLRALLDPGAVRSEVTRLLRQIPADKDLWDGVDLMPASALWRCLLHVPDIGHSKAGKILAKKRPRLLPVYDGTVALAFSDFNAALLATPAPCAQRWWAPPQGGQAGPPR